MERKRRRKTDEYYIKLAHDFEQQMKEKGFQEIAPFVKYIKNQIKIMNDMLKGFQLMKKNKR